MRYLQKLGKALMLPVSCLPICGLLMGLGYFLCPAAMQGGDMTGAAAAIGFFLVKAGSALIDHMALLFVIGVGIGMSENNDGTGAVAALASWLMITTLLSVNTVSALLPSIADNENSLLAFSKIDNPFIGILAGLIGSACYNRFKGTKLPDWLSFFSGKRCVAIIAGLISIVMSFLLLFVWPLIFSGLVALGKGIAGLGAVGAGLYAFLNRLLIPVGLHHALNNVFWFDTIGLGDLSHFWAGETSADVSWSLGMYMSGFFPCMMFGIPAAALAVVRCAKPEKKKAVMGIMLSCAACSFVCGVTEPFEFAFMFLAPTLYVLYALMYGVITYITVISGFRAGFSFSGGATDLIFSASLPAAERTWMILPLGLLAFVLFYGLFRFAITKWDLKMPGREDDESESATGNGRGRMNSESAAGNGRGRMKPESAAGSGRGRMNSESAAGNGKGRMKPKSRYREQARIILQGMGGASNIVSIDNCITRLRLEVRDASLVDEKTIRSAGVPGVIKTGKNSVQVVVGTTVQFVADEFRLICEETDSEDAYEIGVNAAENTDPIIDTDLHPNKRTAAAVSHESTALDDNNIPQEKVHRMVTHHDTIFEKGPSQQGDGFGSGNTKPSQQGDGSGSGKTDASLQGDSFDFAITDVSGIHARPAGAISTIAKKYACEILVSANGKSCSAKSITGLMSLGAAEGTVLTVKASGTGAEKALSELYLYMEENL